MKPNQLLRCSPESQGVSSSAILTFVERAEQEIHELHSLMLLRHGSVVAEGWWSPYAPQLPHMLFSLSKSFTSTAVGMAVTEGRLSIDDRVLSFFPDQAPKQPSENLAAMRVRHLLAMSTGHAEETIDLMTRGKGDWVKQFLNRPVDYAPGTHFVYNSGASYMLSAIVQKVTGEPLVRYLKPRLFEPLGITKATWEFSPQRINTGGWGLSITTESIARFGQLYLQKGIWNGQRLLPEEWIRPATSVQTPNGPTDNPDWGQGYGFQFWMCRHGAYRGDGAFGQFCVVMPEQEAVLAVTSGMGEMQPLLDLVWEILLPAMECTPLREDRPTQKALKQKLASLKFEPPAGTPDSPLAASLSGKKYTLADNIFQIDAVSFDFSGENPAFRLFRKKNETRIFLGKGIWVPGRISLVDRYSRPVVSSGRWTSEDTFEMTLRFYETPFLITAFCCFSEKRLALQFDWNVAFSPTKIPEIAGQAD